MHERYAKDGLVCVSVNIDQEAEKLPGALAFLRQRGATFTNLHLEEPDEAIGDHFHTGGLPLIVVYDREGHATQFDVDHEDRPPNYTKAVEPFVRKLLGLN
jgi:hypothetical protein